MIMAGLCWCAAPLRPPLAVEPASLPWRKPGSSGGGATGVHLGLECPLSVLPHVTIDWLLRHGHNTNISPVSTLSFKWHFIVKAFLVFLTIFLNVAVVVKIWIFSASVNLISKRFGQILQDYFGADQGFKLDRILDSIPDNPASPQQLAQASGPSTPKAITINLFSAQAMSGLQSDQTDDQPSLFHLERIKSPIRQVPQ